MQTSCQGADAVEAGGAKHEATQRILITNDHIQSAIGLAGTAFGERAAIRRRAWQRLHAVLGNPLTGLAIAHADGASGLPVEQRVVSPEVQLRFVEQQPYRNTAQLVVLALAQLVI